MSVRETHYYTGQIKEWIAIAKDRPKWRQQTHSKPEPPDA